MKRIRVYEACVALVMAVGVYVAGFATADRAHEWREREAAIRAGAPEKSAETAAFAWPSSSATMAVWNGVTPCILSSHGVAWVDRSGGLKARALDIQLP